MRTVITYLVVGQSEGEQRETKMGNEIRKSRKRNRAKARGRKETN